ncbi:hypothetical protein [Desulforhopalus sp. 52FAK]
MASKLFLLIQFVPLSIFLAITRWPDGSDSPNWKMAFIVGGGIALVETILLSRRKNTFNRFILAVNVFLFVGGMGFLLSIGPILSMYKNLMQSALFSSLIVVGLLTTFFSAHGFIGVEHPNRKLVINRSIYLLLASLFAFSFSLFFRGNTLLSGILPFISLLFFGKILRLNMNDKTTIKSI